MTRFRFPLARLLSLRERRERDATIALATARAGENALRAMLASAQARRDAARAEVTPAPGTSRTIAELHNAAFLVEQLDVRNATMSGQLDSAVSESARLHTSLIERVRERRVIERLRDRQHAGWRVAEDRREREEMDSVAQTRRRAADDTPLSRSTT